MIRRLCLGLALTVLAVQPAMAHPPPLGVGGFAGGLLHPLLVPAHGLALVGLGVLIGQQAGWGRAVVVAGIVALAAGLGVMTLGVVPLFVGEALLALAALTGLLVALARPVSEIAGGVLATATGFAIALDSPPEVLSLREANLMLAGTGLGAALLLIVTSELARRLQSAWPRIAMRILGSWIAASAILVLAVRLVR
jgi:hydrogenase/urease accessory protein HupE